MAHPFAANSHPGRYAIGRGGLGFPALPGFALAVLLLLPLLAGPAIAAEPVSTLVSPDRYQSQVGMDVFNGFFYDSDEALRKDFRIELIPAPKSPDDESFSRINLKEGLLGMVVRSPGKGPAPVVRAVWTARPLTVKLDTPMHFGANLAISRNLKNNSYRCRIGLTALEEKTASLYLEVVRTDCQTELTDQPVWEAQLYCATDSGEPRPLLAEPPTSNQADWGTAGWSIELRRGQIVLCRDRLPLAKAPQPAGLDDLARDCRLFVETVGSKKDSRWAQYDNFFLQPLAATSPRTTRSLDFGWQLLGPAVYGRPDFARKPRERELLDRRIQPTLDAGQLPPVDEPIELLGESFTWRPTRQSFVRDRVAIEYSLPNGRMLEWSVLYATTTFRNDEPLENVRLLFGSRDLIRIWIDGREVGHYQGPRGPHRPDTRRSEPFDLKPGTHRVLVKLVSLEWGVPGFGMRFVTADHQAIRILPPEHLADFPPAATNNVLANGSFEIGLSDWMVLQDSIDSSWSVVHAADLPHGGSCLKVTPAGSGDDAVVLASPPAILDPADGPCELSLWARAEGQATLTLVMRNIRDGFNPDRVGSWYLEKTFPLTSEWKRYVLQFHAPPSAVDNYRPSFELRGAGTAWVDAVSLSQTPGQTAYQQASPLEMVMTTDEPMNFAALGEPVRATFRLAAAKGTPRPEALHVTLRDVSEGSHLPGKVVRPEQTIALRWNDHGQARTEVTWENLELGLYRAAFRAGDLTRRIDFAVLVPLDDSPLDAESPFGIHASPDRVFDARQFARAMKRMGVGMVRLNNYPRWDKIEREKGKPDWAFPPLLSAMKEVGLAGLGHAYAVPEWARMPGIHRPYYRFNTKPADPERFSRYYTESVEHFGSAIFAWEYWNEPDLGHRNWSHSVKEFVKLQKHAYRGVKRADPNATFMAPSLCHINLGWLERAFQAGMGDCVDILSLHGYRDTPPETFDEDLAKVRALLARHGRADMPIAVTELGYPGWDAWSQRNPFYLKPKKMPPQREIDKATMLARSYVVLMAGGVEFLAWYRMTDSMPQGGGGGFDRNGITTDYPVAQPRAAVVAYNTVVSELAHATAVERIDSAEAGDLPPEVRLYRFVVCDKPLWVAWTTGKPGTYALKLPHAQTIRVKTIMGKTYIRDVQADRLTLPLTGSPLFLRPVDAGS